MIRLIGFIYFTVLISGCTKTPSCDDAEVLDAVKASQAQVFYKQFLKGVTLGGMVDLPDGVEAVYEKAYTPDSAQFIAIRQVDSDDDNHKVSCLAQLSMKIDVRAHEREFEAGLAQISKANPNSILLSVLGTVGLKSEETRSISYTAQPDTEGKIYVETYIED